MVFNLSGSIMQSGLELLDNDTLGYLQVWVAGG